MLCSARAYKVSYDVRQRCTHRCMQQTLMQFQLIWDSAVLTFAGCKELKKVFVDVGQRCTCSCMQQGLVTTSIDVEQRSTHKCMLQGLMSFCCCGTARWIMCWASWWRAALTCCGWGDPPRSTLRCGRTPPAARDAPTPLSPACPLRPTALVWCAPIYETHRLAIESCTPASPALMWLENSLHDLPAEFCLQGPNRALTYWSLILKHFTMNPPPRGSLVKHADLRLHAGREWLMVRPLLP